MIVNLWLEYAKRKSGLILGKWWLKWIVRVRATKCPELFILTCSLYIKMFTFYISTGGAGSILLIRRNSLLLRETMSRNKHNTRLVSAGPRWPAPARAAAGGGAREVRGARGGLPLCLSRVALDGERPTQGVRGQGGCSCRVRSWRGVSEVCGSLHRTPRMP